MLTEHPSFNLKPESGQILRRYTSIEFLIWTLQQESIWFSQAVELEDKFEGALGKINDDIVRKSGIVGSIPTYLGIRSKAGEELKKLIYVNCWHASNEESFAMWKIYGARGMGLAIKTTYSSLEKSIKSDFEVFGGNIQYVDYKTEPIPESNAFDRFIRKRKGFGFEEEFRLATMGPTQTATNARKGIAVKVNINELIDEIVLAPGSRDFHKQLFENMLSKYNFNIKVVNSDLDSL